MGMLRWVIALDFMIFGEVLDNDVTTLKLMVTLIMVVEGLE